jgi:hypothetical protein
VRERSAIIAIAVVAAGATAGGALAHPQLDASGSTVTGGSQAVEAGGSDVVAVTPGSKYQPLPGQRKVTIAPESQTPVAAAGNGLDALAGRRCCDRYRCGTPRRRRGLRCGAGPETAGKARAGTTGDHHGNGSPGLESPTLQ